VTAKIRVRKPPRDIQNFGPRIGGNTNTPPTSYSCAYLGTEIPTDRIPPGMVFLDPTYDGSSRHAKFERILPIWTVSGLAAFEQRLHLQWNS